MYGLNFIIRVDPLNMLVVIILLCGVLVVYMIWKYTKYVFSEHRQAGLPGPAGNFLFGNSFDLSITDFIGNVVKLSKLARLYGPIFRLRVFGQHMVFLNSEEIIRKAMTESTLADNFSDRPATAFHDLINYEGIFAIRDGNGSLIKSLRRNLVQGLHTFGEGIQTFEDIVKQELSRLHVQLEEFGEREFEFNQVITESLYNVISILLIGEPIPSKSLYLSFRKHIHTNDQLLNPITSNLLLTFPFLRNVPGKFKTMVSDHNNTKHHILQHYFYAMKETFAPGQMRGLVDFYLNQQHTHPDSVGLSDKCIQFAILDVINAGSATSTATISSLVLCLMNHLDIQETIQNEIDNIEGTPSLDDKANCPYTEATILEVFRYNSIVPFLVPRSSTADSKLHGYTIPRNSVIMVNVWYLWHNEDIWGDPWVFRPERFLDENGELIPRSDAKRKCMIQFGLGRRRCPGEGLATSRVFLYLTAILKRWTIMPPNERQPSCDPRTGDFDVFILSTPKPFNCIMKRRCKKMENVI